MIVDLCVVPIGVGAHLAPYIAACERVLLEAGLKIQLHPNGTGQAFHQVGSSSDRRGLGRFLEYPGPAPSPERQQASGPDGLRIAVDPTEDSGNFPVLP